jgi:predicted RND superfamily exporter protein
MKALVDSLRPKIDSIFNPKDYNVVLTGHSLVFLKNNDYLLANLYESLLIEIILIALVGMALFRSVRIILLSKLPCLIPLVITAGVMGFLDIRFKPSTILIFSIAFGIASDGTVYFLTKYRQELKKGLTAPQAISLAVKETGLSMVYTNIILFFGFIIFAASSFGGTVAMGILVSLTLVVSMCTNLILLPAILLSIDNRKTEKEILEKPLIELEDNGEKE